MRRFLGALIAGTILIGATGAQALSVTTTMHGDDDCFGETDTSPCTTGLFPALPSFDNRTALDGLFTDYFTTHNAVSFDFFVALGGETLVSADVSLRSVGMDIHVTPLGGGDADVGTTFAINGTVIGTYFEPVVINTTQSSRTVADLSYAIPVGLLQDNQTNTLTITPESDFGLAPFEDYAIDFVTIQYTTQATVPPTAPVPLPAAAWLMAAGLAALAGLRRRLS